MKKTILFIAAIMVYSTSFAQKLANDNEYHSSNFTYSVDWQSYIYDEDTTGNYYEPYSWKSYENYTSSYDIPYYTSYYAYNYNTDKWEKTDTLHYYTTPDRTYECTLPFQRIKRA